MRALGLILTTAIVPASLALAASFPARAADPLAAPQPVAQPADPGMPVNSIVFGGELIVAPGAAGDAIAPGGTTGANRDSVLGGFSFGGTLAAQIGSAGGTPIFVELTGAIVLGIGRSIDTETYSGNDSLLVTAGSAPTLGTMDLNTGVGVATADGVVNLTDSTGDSATISTASSSPPGNNATATYAVSETATGAALLALTTDGTGPAGAAYGVLADANGFALVGVGDLGDTTVTRETNESLLLATTRAMFSAPIALDNGWSVTPRLGPSYSLLQRSVHHETLIDVDDGPGLDGTIPLFGLEHNDDLTAHYFGGVIGGSVSGPISERWRVSVGGEVGVSGYWADYTGTASAIIPDIADVELPGYEDSISGTTLYNRVSGGVSYLDPNGMTLSFGVHVDRLGNVPYVETTQVAGGNATFSGGNSDADFSGSGETLYEKSIATGPMWNVGASISLTNRF